MKHFISTVSMKAILRIMVIGLEENRWLKFRLLRWYKRHVLLKKRLKDESHTLPKLQ